LGTWDLSPDVELSDERTVHPQPTRSENIFFVHEILQLVLPSNNLALMYLVCGTSSEHDERQEVERKS